MDEARPRDPYTYRPMSGRFADFVRLHAAPSKLITVEQERDLLKAALADFGLTLEEAGGVLRGTAHDSGITLESEVEGHLRHYLTEPRNRYESRRAAQGRPPKSISRRRFEQAVDFYQTLTRAVLPREEARKRVKGMVKRMAMKARRDWLRLGTRKWYNGIPDVT